MTLNFINIGLTLAGLLLIFLFYLPAFKHIFKNPRKALLYILFWVILLSLTTSIIDYLFFPTLQNNDLYDSNNSYIET